MWTRPPGFATLVRIIMEQQVSLKSGAAAYERLSAGVGRVTPGRVLDHTHAQLRRMGLTRQKARYCHELARAVQSRQLPLSKLGRMSEDDVRTALIAVPGIGRWTADIYLLSALRRADIWPRGDLALYQIVREIKGQKLDAAVIDELAERWSPWRAVAARVLWHAYLERRRQARA